MRPLLASFVLLAGCATTPVVVKSDPVDVHVLPECFVECAQCVVDTIAQISIDPDSALIAAITEHDARKQCALEEKLCEVRRKVCAAALQRAQASGAIK